ncbi:uncharacterized protein C1orf232 [Chanos chanos]|uniref:Uncharacterized protein C1orf232 n=1 Tax=Chanos chanos TaxID=29144 RepID=A0A6J2VYA2_CHACN|nr:uncharacterized protein C1orf232-like [Chanos chanos]
MNPLWKVYKSKVLKTLNPDMEEDPAEEVNEAEGDMTTVQPDDGPSAVSQLAKKMQGAGVKGWRSVSSLFNRDDEHQLLESESQPAADHPLAVKPEEPPQPNKRTTGFWDNFATKWHQAAAVKRAEAAAASATEGGVDGGQEVGGEGTGMSQDGGTQERVESDDVGEGEGSGGSGGNSFSKYTTLGGGNEDSPAFKWNFVTSKLAELKNKSMAKGN